jgi:hypothetical protein
MKDWLYGGMELVLVVLLFITFWQDIRTRSVSVWVLAGLLAGVLTLRLLTMAVSRVGLETGINAAIVGIELLAMTLYLSAKYQIFTQPIGKFLGLGDVIFWAVPAVFFSPISFLWFLGGSGIFALLTHTVLRLALPNRYPATIPLAGLQALWMIAVMVGYRLNG